MDLVLNNLQRLICHKTQQTKPNQFSNKLPSIPWDSGGLMPTTGLSVSPVSRYAFL